MTIIEQIKAEIERLKSIEYPCDNSQQATGFFNAIDRMTDFLDTLESEKPINPDDAMKELDEKIALVKRRGTWDGVDVDKYMDEVRGREPEKPIELVEEVKRYYSDNFEYISSDQPTLSILTNIARHFYELGCRRTAEKYDEIEYNRQRAEENASNDLEEAAHLFSQSPEPLYSPGHRFHWDDDALFGKQIETTFIAGAKWQAEHTHLPEGVEGEIEQMWDELQTNFREINEAFEAGKKEQKEQMMKEAIHYVVQDDLDSHGASYNIPFIRIGTVALKPKGIGVGDKVRIIIVKEDKS